MNLEDQRNNCPGFLDEYGIWNNGFECPSLPNRIRVCCGSDSHRYCCLLDPSNPSAQSSNETASSLLKKIHLTWLTLPLRLTCLFILLFLLIILILFLYYRYYQRKNTSFEPTTKETLLIDHFSFSPPHHQLFFNENNQPIKEILTSNSSTSARLPSDIYFNDWKEFFQPTEQSMNVYPTISSHNYEMNHYYPRDNDDVIV